MLAHRELSAQSLFGAIDTLKLHSCWTLFARVAPEEPAFARGLTRHFGGAEDARTLALL